MAEKDNITIYKRLTKSKAFFIFLVPISLALIVGIFQELYYRYEIKGELNKINTEIANLNEQKNGLNNLLDYYKNESNLEREARVKLNLKKEGEKVVIILPSATSTGENGGAIYKISQNIENMPNYKQWWYYFLRRD